MLDETSLIYDLARGFNSLEINDFVKPRIKI